MASYDSDSFVHNFINQYKSNIMTLKIILTWSKIVALFVLGGAIYLDVKNGTGATAFMFALPFVVVLITGKQIIDKNNEK